MSVKFSGKIHPYIDDLPIFEDKVDEIAESLDEVGLLHPITLDGVGQVIGGRHRLAACEVAGVDPIFEVWGGNPLSFMLHDNDARKHQTTGQLAAEKALTLDRAGLRNDGRWKYGSLENPASGELGKKFAERLREAGIILDYLGRERLGEVATGEALLKQVFEEARREKERRERERREREEFEANQAKNEADAELFFQAKPKAMQWYGEQTEGKYQTWLEAKTGYLAYDKEQAWEEEKARREEEQKHRDHLDTIKREAERLKQFLYGYGQAWSMREHPYREEVLAQLDQSARNRFSTIEKEISWPSVKHN